MFGFLFKRYNEMGFNKKGIRKNGTKWDYECYNSEGFNREDYRRDGYNSQGFNREGYRRDGYNAEGYDKEGFNKNGFNKYGIDRENYNLEGYNFRGYDRDGYNSRGYDKYGYDVRGYNKYGDNKKGQSKFDESLYKEQVKTAAIQVKSTIEKQPTIMTTKPLETKEEIKIIKENKQGSINNPKNKMIKNNNFSKLPSKILKSTGDTLGKVTKYAVKGSAHVIGEIADINGAHEFAIRTKEMGDITGELIHEIGKFTGNIVGEVTDIVIEKSREKIADINNYDDRGYNQEGYNREGFNQEGYDKSGYDRKGYHKERLNQYGFNELENIQSELRINKIKFTQQKNHMDKLLSGYIRINTDLSLNKFVLREEAINRYRQLKETSNAQYQLIFSILTKNFMHIEELRKSKSFQSIVTDEIFILCLILST